jgi:PAS domain S-box-containing protein
MAQKNITPVNQEIAFLQNEIIVSKTDLKGTITYANDVFCRVAEISTDEAIGQPHSIIRHPDMPRTIFKLLWDTIQAKKEIFAHVQNMSKTGKYYWVIAHITPSLDASGNITGYHSNRRKPNPKAITIISSLYQDILKIEKIGSRKDALIAGEAHLNKVLEDAGQTFDEFIWSLEG